MKTPIAALAISALLFGLGGCQSGGNKTCQTATNASQPEEEVVSFGVLGLNATGAQRLFPNQLVANRPGGAFAPAGTLVAEERTFAFSNSHQILEVTDSLSPSPALAAKALLGCASFTYTTADTTPTTVAINRDFSGQLGTYSVPSGNPANPAITLESGWAYIQTENAYSNSGPTGYRPVVRTKRVVAMSQGTSMLIFSDPTDNSSGSATGGEELIINRMRAGGASLKVKLNDPSSTIVTVPPESFISVYGTENNPASTSPETWKITTNPASTTKLKVRALMKYAKRARDAAYNIDTGE